MKRFSDETDNRDYFDSVSAFWHDVYDRPDTFAGYRLLRQHQFVIDTVNARGDRQTVLDIGCGAGVTALALARQGHRVSGLDIAPRMIERARHEAHATGIACEFNIASARHLPYAAAAFDVVYALGLLSNVRDDVGALHEMRRVLRPGGLLLATVVNLIALDVLLALPRSLPIMLQATRWRDTVRQVGNIGRRISGRAPKAAAVRFSRPVVPGRYVRRFEQVGFSDVMFRALTVGPLLPLGFHLLTDAGTIALSERLVAAAEQGRLPHSLGSSVMVAATKPVTV